MRTMQETDIDTMLQLQKKVLESPDFNADWFYPFPRKELEELMEMRDSIILGIYVGERLAAFRVGCCAGAEFEEIAETLEGKCTKTPCFLMNGVFVDKDFRGNNLQQMMSEYTIERCKENGVETFITAIHPDNTASIQSLKNIGFKEKKRQTIYGGNYDRVILVKEKTDES